MNPPRVADGPAPLALNTAGDDESSLLKDYSIEKLFEAAGVLRVAFDATISTEGEPASVAGCSLSHEEAERYLNGIRILIDGAKPTEKMKYAANPAEYVKTHQIENCDAACALIAEGLGDSCANVVRHSEQRWIEALQASRANDVSTNGTRERYERSIVSVDRTPTYASAFRNRAF